MTVQTTTAYSSKISNPDLLVLRQLHVKEIDRVNQGNCATFSMCEFIVPGPLST